MSSRWGKVAADFHFHPKVMGAGRLAREIFIWAICRNADGRYGGRVPRSWFAPAYLARVLEVSEAEVEEGLKRAETVKLLRVSNDAIVIVGWNEDEWGNPAARSTERVRRFRERQRQQPTEIATHETGETERNVSIPRNETETLEERRVEESRDIERGEKERPLSQTRGRRKPELPIPPDWQPSEEHHSLASELGVDLKREAARFRDHALANDRRQRDWSAAFRVWLSKAQEYQRTHGLNGSRRGEELPRVGNGLRLAGRTETEWPGGKP